MTTLLNLTSKNRMFNRSIATFNGVFAQADSSALALLDEMNKLLGNGAFTLDKTVNNKLVQGNFEEFLKLPLLPKEEKKFQANSFLKKIEKKVADLSLEDCINRNPELSHLRYEFQDYMHNKMSTLNFEQRTILSYDNIVSYLVAWAVEVKQAKDINAVANYVFNNNGGIAAIQKYVVVSSADKVIHEEQLNVAQPSKIYDSLILQKVSLSENTLRLKIDEAIDNYIHNSTELDIIKKVEKEIGDIDDELYPALVNYIKNSPVKITDDNAKFFIPHFITHLDQGINGNKPQATKSLSLNNNDDDYEIEFLVDDNATMEVSAGNLKSGAQLAYAKIMDLELEIFNVMDYFTHRYLVNKSITMKDLTLRDDLQMYVMSNKFTHEGIVYDRTKPSEREMFYKQVLNAGNAKLSEDFVINDDFKPLWKNLIVECAKYINRVQESPNPEGFVSRQSIMQAIEDLQYNISTHCTGMAFVNTPVICKEIHFIKSRILNHPEVIRQIVPSGGPWYKVLEVLYLAMRNRRAKTSTIYNKAKLTHSILKGLMTYNPSTFEDNKQFNPFISKIEALIICEGNLNAKREGDHDDDTDHANPYNNRGTAGLRSGTPEPVAADEWE